MPVFTLGSLPTKAPGWANAASNDATVALTADRLAKRVVRVSDATKLIETILAAGIEPGVTADVRPFPYWLVRRSVENGEILFLFNAEKADRADTIHLNVPGNAAAVLDPQSGQQLSCTTRDDMGEPLTLTIAVPARRGIVVWVTDGCPQGLQ